MSEYKWGHMTSINRPQLVRTKVDVFVGSGTDKYGINRCRAEEERISEAVTCLANGQDLSVNGKI